MPIPNKSLSVCAVLACALGITFGAYWPGLQGSFLFDDFNSLKSINDYGGVTDIDTALRFVFGNDTGPTGRPVSMLSFIINDQYWPGSPAFFKYTNLLIHLIIGVLIFALARAIFRRVSNNTNTDWAALATAAIWLVHPLNASTTLYIIQRMTQLSALFTILGVLAYLSGRSRLFQGKSFGWTLLAGGVPAFCVLATLSKENGFLLVAYIAVIELTIFSNSSRPKHFKFWLSAFIALPALLFVGYLGVSWERFASSYAWRDFHLAERLLTESRILCLYLKEILIPDVKGMGLFHDDIAISQSPTSPPGTAVSLAIIAILASLAFWIRKKQPILALAILWFFAGHLMESTVIPLELYFEHRNYLPMVGPLIAIGYYAIEGANGIATRWVRWTTRALPVGLVALYVPMTAYSTVIWSDRATMFAINEVEHPASLRAKRALAGELERLGLAAQALKVAEQARTQFPDSLSVPLFMLVIECKHGLESSASLETIQEVAPVARPIDGISASLEQLIELSRQETCPDLANNDSLVKLYQAVEKIPELDRRRDLAARIYFQHANVEAMRRQLDTTMRLLDKAYKLQPTVDIALKQAVVLSSAGLYEEALERLQNAKRADAERLPFVPSRMPELRQVEKALEQNLKSDESKSGH